jgi:DNA-binding NarL/FixJ family response regulator
MTDHSPIRVLVVDDDALVRAGLSLMLRAAPDILVVAGVADGAGVEEAIRRHHPDVLLMDIRMPGVDGITATRLARARPHPPEVIVLTTFDTDEHLLHALRAGASGFLLKDTPPAQIVAAIHRVAGGEPILSSAATRRLMAHVAQADRQPRREAARRSVAALTGREREVAAAVGRGASNAELAAALHMSVATAKAHVSRILAKLGLTNRVQLALLVNDAGDAEP